MADAPPQTKATPVPPAVMGATSLYLLVVLGLPILASEVLIPITKAAFLLLGGWAVLAYEQQLWVRDLLWYVPVFLVTLFYLKTTFKPLAAYGYKWSTDFFWFAVYLGLGSGIIIFLVDFIQGVARWGVDAYGASSVLGYIVTWAVVIPLFEETLFRGVIQTYYQQHTTTTFTQLKISIAVLIGVAFELLFHLAVPFYTGTSLIVIVPQLIYVAVFGLIGGYFYQKTGSLVTPVLIHGLGNLVELVLIWTLIY